MSRLILCRGIQASGKTTFAQNFVAEDPDNRRRFSRDDIRWEFFRKYWGLDREEENFVTGRQKARILSALTAGLDVVVDDTNLRAKTLKALMRVGEQAGAKVEVVDFPVDLGVAILRDADRQAKGRRYVGEKVIRDYYNRFTPKGKFPPIPVLEPETDSGFKPYVRNGAENLPAAWICDLDGTLAILNGRSPYDESTVIDDLVNWPVRAVVLALAKQGKHIVFTSGRTDACWMDTYRWLEALDIGDNWTLLMRKAGDSRKDAVIKHEIFWRDIAPHYWVQGVLDDRDQVVAMWREIGLVCLQVAPGDF